MAVESDADRASMLADFGVLVVFSPGDTYPNRNDDTREITGIFDNDYFEVDGGETRTRSSQPILTTRSIDVTDAARNSMAEVGTDIYKVVDVQDDGTGIVFLILEGPKI